MPRITYIAGSVDENGLVGKVQRGEMKVRLGPGWKKFIGEQKPSANHKRRKAG